MRTPNLGTVIYNPDVPPVAQDDLNRFFYTELNKISAAINLLALGHLDMTYVAPAKPRQGDIRYADGTQWNPGSGAGLYYYNGSAWTFIA